MDEKPRIVERPSLDAPDFVVDVRTPKEMQAAITNPDRSTLCGGRFKVETAPGQFANLYCAAPNCIQTGSCSGPMFVPNIDQWTESKVMVDADGLPLRTMRRMSPGEMVKASRMAAKAATGKDDPRSDDQIRAYIGRIWKRTMESIRGGGWGPGPDAG